MALLEQALYKNLCLMTYLKFNLSLPDPFADPTWVQAIEDATPFDSRGQALEAKLLIVDATGMIYNDHHWYVVRV